jgi:cysteine-rich repeat protein
MNNVGTWLGVLCTFSLIAASACSDDDGPDQETGGNSGEGGSNDTGGRGGGSGGAPRGGSTQGGAAGNPGSGGGGQPECAVDFPCDEREAECVGGSRIQYLHTVSCRELCPPGPCSGGSCEPDGDPQDCPDGTACRDVRVSLNGYTAVCDDGNGGSGGNRDFEPCGNGQRETGEACDDGNRLADDGCGPDCSVEPDWVCQPDRPCQSLRLDEPCEDACWDQDACLENASHLTCVCPDERPPDCEDVRFRILSRLDGNTDCDAGAISGDGTVVIGSCAWQAPNFGAFMNTAAVWSLGEGVGEFADPAAELLTAVSTDGSVVTGMDAEGIAYRWVDGEPELIAAGFFPWGLSADGSVVVGYGGDGQRPALWSDGELSYFSGPDGETEGTVLAVNPAADTFVGYVRFEGRSQAVRWDASGFAEALPVPAEVTDSEAAAVNDDGSVIVGTVWYGNDTGAIRWTAGSYELLIATPPSGAHALSADGTRIIGDAGYAPWLWDEDGSGESLAELGEVDLSYWLLNGASAISADGTIVVGSAQYIAEDRVNHRPRAFVLYLP